MDIKSNDTKSNDIKSNDTNKHADGWTSDEIFRSMRRNCEAYKKKDIELQKLKKENKQLKKENEQLKKELGFNLKTWNDYILYVGRDGKQRTSREIFNEIELMETKPWASDAKTPESTCSATCGTLFSKNKLFKTNDSPHKYFILLS
jgi:hypothetical protein